MVVCVLTGAGISAESGLRTFRDAGGLWEGYDVMEVASITGWHNNPSRVLDFYNQRRGHLDTVEPNPGHLELVRLEEHFETYIITQNVDDLHERAGSANIIHLHGELRKACSCYNKSNSFLWDKDIHIGDMASDGGQIRPFIVWFGEEVPLLTTAAAKVSNADYILIVGTSMQVYPAASLTAYAPAHCQILYVDPNPQVNYELRQAKNLHLYEGPASTHVKKAVDNILSLEGFS